MPGNIETPGLAETSDEHQRLMLSSIPMGRFGTPEDVGWAVRFLAAAEAGYVTGQTLIVDGGQVLPRARLWCDLGRFDTSFQRASRPVQEDRSSRGKRRA